LSPQLDPEAQSPLLSELDCTPLLYVHGPWSWHPPPTLKCGKMVRYTGIADSRNVIDRRPYPSMRHNWHVMGRLVLFISPKRLWRCHYPAFGSKRWEAHQAHIADLVEGRSSMQ